MTVPVLKTWSGVVDGPVACFQATRRPSVHAVEGGSASGLASGLASGGGLV
jgi:hypothetical protein